MVLQEGDFGVLFKERGNPPAFKGVKGYSTEGDEDGTVVKCADVLVDPVELAAKSREG